MLGREREKWWHEFFGEKAFEVGEWAFLLSGFEGIEGNNGGGRYFILRAICNTLDIYPHCVGLAI